MGIRGVPPGITDPNLRGFLQDIRNALAGVSEKVTKLSTTTTTSSGGGGNPGPGGGGGNPPPDGGGPTPPPSGQSSVVLTISPIKPLTQQSFTLTATVLGTAPTGTIAFQQDGALMGINLVPLSQGMATITSQLPKGTYSFVAQYSGDSNNKSAVSNTLTVEVGSVWDGPPADPTYLATESGIGYIVVKWAIPYIGDLDVVEVWASVTNDIATASKLGESNGSMFVYVPPDLSVSWYFWVRVRDSEGLFSNYYPKTKTGIKGTALSLEAQIANTQLWKDLGKKIGEDEAAISTTSGIVSGPTGLAAQYMVKTDVRGLVSGFGLYNDGNISDFFVRADRFAVGNPETYKGTCSIAGKTTQAECKAAGGTWTWASTSDTNIPFIVYTTPQTITAPDGSGKTLTIQPGVYMKSANIQQGFIGDAQIYGDLKSYSWAASNGPTTYPFNGWRLDKASNLRLYGGSFGLYDEWGVPIIEAGKINNSQIRNLTLTPSAEVFVVPKAPATTITPASIVLTATAQGLGSSAPAISWSVTSGSYTGSLSTAGLQLTIDPAGMATSVVTFKATAVYNSVTYTDSVTLAKVQEGSDALWLYLSNEAQLLSADSKGNVASYQGATTIAKVYRGATDVSSAEGWQFSTPSYTGCNAPNVSGQSISLDDAHAMTSDVANITVRASKGSVTIDRIFTVSKAKQGVDGKVLRLGATSVVVAQDSSGNYTPQTITFTITSSGLTGTPVLQYRSAGSNYGAWNDYGSNTIWSYTNSGGYFPSNYSFMMWRAYSAADNLSDELTLVRSVNGIRGGVFTTLSGLFGAGSAWNAIVSLAGTNPVIGDWVIDSSGSSYSCTSAASYPGEWIGTNIRLNGNVIVNGTLIADKLASGTINSALITLDGPNGAIRSLNYTSTTGFLINGNGDAVFNSGIWRSNLYSSNYDGSVDFPNANSGQNGWCINKYGSAVFNTVLVRKPSNIASHAYGASDKFESSSYTYATLYEETMGPYIYKANVGQTTNILLTLDCQTSLSTYNIEVRDGANNVLWVAYNKSGAAIESRFFSGSTSFYQTINQPYVYLKVHMQSGGGSMGMPRFNIFEIVS